jgi:hypothetical protein
MALFCAVNAFDSSWPRRGLNRRQWLVAGASVLLPSARAAMPPAPVYATRLPGPAELAYDLRYGVFSGRGQLSWQPPVDGRYRLRLSGTALGIHLLTWSSEGGVDRAGLAPLRFSEQRLRRAEQIAQFERGAGRIVFPGRPGKETALLPGTQDRVSWLVQLPSILRAETALQQAGARIALIVAGARGDVDRWVFVVRGAVPVERSDGGSLTALHLVREPQGPRDLVGEAWLDPAREFMPARVRLARADGDESLEFLLR